MVALLALDSEQQKKKKQANGAAQAKEAKESHFRSVVVAVAAVVGEGAWAEADVLAQSWVFD